MSRRHRSPGNRRKPPELLWRVRRLILEEQWSPCQISSYLREKEGIGCHLGEEINAGQALFQKNTAQSIWVAYMYLNPVASVGAGCYVLWQNIINSVELWQKRRENIGHP